MTDQKKLENNVVYEMLWRSLHDSQLNKTEYSSNILDSKYSETDYSNTFKYFQEHHNPKTIFLKKITNEKINDLKSFKISSEFLMNNFTKRIDKVTHDSREFQERAINDKYVYAVCPITGDILKSNQSVVIKRSVIFYRFTGAKVFYLITSNLGTGFNKDTIYFPDRDLIVRYEKHQYGFLEEHLVILKAITVCNYHIFSNYFYNEKAKKNLAVMIGHSNFAHHLWNELSGLERLCKENLLNNIEQFFVFREPLGKINHIFPEINQEKINYIDVNSSFLQQAITDDYSFEVIEEIVSKQYFFVNIGDKFITDSLARKLLKISSDEVNLSTKKTIEEAQKSYFPLLWISIRNNDRTWNDQYNGLIKIIGSLFQDYPKLGVIFDGFSIPTDYLASELKCELSLSEIKMIEEQKELINKIISQLDSQIKIYDIVGCSLFEANLWAHAIDLYLCHYGTLQHKVGWLALKPGVVHLNAKLAASNAAKFRAYGVREYGISPKFIDASYIKDLPTKSSILMDLRSDISNYEIDWKIIHQELLQLIREIEKSKTPFRKFIGYLTKTKQYLASKLSQVSRLKKLLKR